jgi:hypothetical protein
MMARTPFPSMRSSMAAKPGRAWTGSAPLGLDGIGAAHGEGRNDLILCVNCPFGCWMAVLGDTIGARKELTRGAGCRGLRRALGDRRERRG